MTIVLAGGGTAGHVLPALALLPKLKKHFENIFFIGAGGIERELAARAGVPFYAVPAVKFRRSLSPKNLLIPFRLIRGIAAARKTLKQLKPDVVFSKGGYVALPVVMAAAGLKIPVISHESDMTMGLANRIGKRFSKVVCTTFEPTAKGLASAVWTGSPVREELFKGSAQSALQKAGFAKVQPVVLVVGGSSGAKALNAAVIAALNRMADFNVLHLVGKGNLSGIKADNYAQFEYAHDMEHFFAAADVVVSRAGAGSLNELLALRKPAVLVPLPKSGASRGDQVQNAEYFERRGFAKVLPQAELSPLTLAASVRTVFFHRADYTKKLSAVKLPDAANAVVEQILKAIKR